MVNETYLIRGVIAQSFLGGIHPQTHVNVLWYKLLEVRSRLSAINYQSLVIKILPLASCDVGVMLWCTYLMKPHLTNECRHQDT